MMVSHHVGAGEPPPPHPLQEHPVLLTSELSLDGLVNNILKFGATFLVSVKQFKYSIGVDGD